MGNDDAGLAMIAGDMGFAQARRRGALALVSSSQVRIRKVRASGLPIAAPSDRSDAGASGADAQRNAAVAAFLSVSRDGGATRCGLIAVNRFQRDAMTAAALEPPVQDPAHLVGMHRPYLIRFASRRLRKPL